MAKVAVGLEVLAKDINLQKQFMGNVALLCHNASIDSSCHHASYVFKSIFGHRFKKLFGPQHGFSTDAQDNMIETDHSIHPYFNIPIYSLYSETRVPTDEMLEGIDHFFVDLQDIGCRMYTYVYTLTLLLEKCATKDIEVIILDRPNPINGNTLEGNILDTEFASFIGRHPMPVRHGLTIGELGLLHQKLWARAAANVRVIHMKAWEREMYFTDTGLPWALPSPNIARAESCLVFPSTVMFEGTHLSEGRGTTQPLEIVGYPKIEPFSLFSNHLEKTISNSGLKGFAIRPILFLPTFHKFKDEVCGGFQIHVTDRETFQPWRTGQLLLRELFCHMEADFKWLEPPYEYIHHLEPIDILNGTHRLRHWVEKRGTLEELEAMEQLEAYKEQQRSIALY
ncbi:DUF1343 domain-containing protein [Flagellimonas sp. 389]|uniref:DUF1343 domain-containing protein n=1 Tax=Flagellimonas sp. 389 TaxID=2835862 RepID=UPI001BD5F0A0|nr:DUF1343 domain-containing protein [Flagellimonas sp. 389]MBS9462044.1 DUF1343 domain-containing protein [Flagellimonas sp. 389]